MDSHLSRVWLVSATHQNGAHEIMKEDRQGDATAQGTAGDSISKTSRSSLFSLLGSASNPMARKLSSEFYFINVYDFWHHRTTSRSKRAAFPLVCPGDLVGRQGAFFWRLTTYGKLTEKLAKCTGWSCHKKSKIGTPWRFSFGKMARDAVSALTLFWPSPRPCRENSRPEGKSSVSKI